MKQNSFVSIVGVLNEWDEVSQLPAYFQAVFGVLDQHFSDFEFVLVNNSNFRNFEQLQTSVPEAYRQHVFVLNLSTVVNENHAIIAGLDRANGDYTIIFEWNFGRQPQLILDLFEASQQGFDVVYLRANARKAPLFSKWLSGLFYQILRRYSALKLDPLAHDTRIISRRALNSILRLRENLRYMKAIYSLVGYPTSHLQVDQPLLREQHTRFADQFRTSLVAITSFTTFLRSLLLWIFIFSFLFLIGVVVNALKVRFTNLDLFGNYYETVPGWTFLVVLISIFFAITCLNLYIMSIYLSNIYNEIKQRPLYILESVRRL